MTHRYTDYTTFLCCLAIFWASSCAEEGESDAVDGGDTETEIDTDGLFVEAHEPEDGAVVQINQKIHILFSGAPPEQDYVDPETVVVLVDGEPVRARPYFTNEAGNREFRFVPFPVWAPAEQHEVTIVAGAALAGDPEIRLAEDFVFGFTVDDTPFDEEYDPEVTADLSTSELAAMHAGGEDAFLESNLVKDWDDPDSTLYNISIPVRPDDPEVGAFALKLLDSQFPLGAVGLAAPQVAVGRRMFAADVNSEQRVFVNPRIVDWAQDDLYYGYAEGCLSIDGVSSFVGRPAWIAVEFDTPEGDHVENYDLEDFDAKVWLHEYDHINGILMTDREEGRTW